jgi:hypothetical protein
MTSAILYFQLLTFLVAVFCYRGLLRFSIGLFVPIFFIEALFALMYTKYRVVDGSPIVVLNNIRMVLTYCLDVYVFSRMIRPNRIEKVIVNILLVVGCLFILLNTFVFQGSKHYDSFSWLLLIVIQVIFSALILMRMSLIDEDSPPFFRHPYLWIASANLLYGLFSLVLWVLFQFFLGKNVQFEFGVVLPIEDVIFILYCLMFCYAFILCKTQKISYSRLY